MIVNGFVVVVCFLFFIWPVFVVVIVYSLWKFFGEKNIYSKKKNLILKITQRQKKTFKKKKKKSETIKKIFSGDQPIQMYISHT